MAGTCRWNIPLDRCGIINEHKAVRTGVGIFDVSHMGDIRLAGPEALAAVQHISMNDASRLAMGRRSIRRCSIRRGRLSMM